MDNAPKWKKQLRSFLGLNYQTTYVRDYIFRSNMRACIHMSIVTFCVELWILFHHKQLGTAVAGSEKNLFYYMQTVGDILLPIASVITLAVSILYFCKKMNSRTTGHIVIGLFSVVCIGFGAVISFGGFHRGEGVLAFTTMVLTVYGMLIWRPVTGVLTLTAIYGIFAFLVDQIVIVPTGYEGLTVESEVNLFAMWIATAVICVVNYHKAVTHAQKDENLEKMNTHLSEVSVKDELTGIHNMVYFRAEAEKILNYVTTNKESSVFLFMDIENFKSYNEKYGFHKGNELLAQIAHTIVRSFKGSLVSRFSDDHFVVFTTTDGLMDNIQTLSDTIKNCQGEVHLELKCGAYKPSGKDDTDPILACDRARFACNSIKKHFDCNFRYYDEQLEAQFQLKQYIVNNIDTAIENGYIKVYYQPVVSMETGKVCGLEALARWLDPNYGLLSPGAFISILEEYRQIHKLDRCIIEQVCRDYRDSVDNSKPFPPVSINFSRLDFELCDMVGYLAGLAEQYGVPKEFIDVEITETALSDQQDFLPSMVDALRKAGYKVWLDDFGSGYSSLNVLKDYQFDVLKIDMKFLESFGSNDKTIPILKNIIELSKQLHMISLTEGVETQEQYDFLRLIGCDRTQGYLFSKPIPLETLRQRIEDGELDIAEEYCW